MLLTLYKLLTGNRVDCPRYGSHWELIGFQVRILIYTILIILNEQIYMYIVDILYYTL